MASAQSLLRKAHYVPLAAVGFYAVVMYCLTVPWIQREFTFLNNVKLPLFAKYDSPQMYGLAPFKTRNVYLDTPDGERLGAWHVLYANGLVGEEADLSPQSVYSEQAPFPPRGPLSDDVFDAAMAQRPTIIYYHGNAATRAVGGRIRGYVEMSSRLDCNVVAIDYRGYADSTGVPSQAGLITDARTAWDWVAERISAGGNDAADNIVVVGHSLGTGVTSALAGQLADEGIYPRALALIAPFTSISELLSSYWLFGVIPLLSPIRAIPPVADYFKRRNRTPFNSLEAISRTRSPTLILHSLVDEIIPPSHSQRMFRQVVAPNATAEAADAALGRVEEVRYPGWGVMKSATRDGLPMVYLEADAGGHNNIGWAEGTLDLIAKIADL